MGKNFSPFPAPKRGVKRMIAKRPAGKKKSGWNQVPYQRDAQGPSLVRKDQTKWHRSLQELLSQTDRGILRLLQKDKVLPDWTGAVCPHCNFGKLGSLMTRPKSDCLVYRCNRKHCQHYISPVELHPLFTKTMGPEGHSLQKQAAALLLRLVNVPLADIHILTHMNHKAIEKLNKSLLFLRKGYVQEAEKSILFGGNPRNWKDVEVDEATFDKRTLQETEVSKKDFVAGKTVQWEQWGGLVQRGSPDTLVLAKLNPAITVPRAPGPGAMRKVDWKPLANKWLKDRSVVLHSDFARSYRMKISGVVHDAVTHKKRRVKRDGKFVWVQPTYVKVSTHTLPGGRRIKTKAGTQIIDRAWRFIKERLKRNQAVKAGSTMLAAQIRSAQCEYWHRKDDLWLSTGKLVEHYMKGMVRKQ